MNSQEPDDDFLPEEPQKPDPDRGRRVAVRVAFLLVLIIAADIISLTMLGSNANVTFSKIGSRIEK